jgi:hypothetical protein
MDYFGNVRPVTRGIQMLLDAGFKGRNIMCYVLVGFDTTFAQDLHRWRVLRKDLGVYPFVMIYNNRRDDPKLRAFARWVNRRIDKVCSWEDYDRNPERWAGPRYKLLESFGVG